jgi:hypothetical protein
MPFAAAFVVAACSGLGGAQPEATGSSPPQAGFGDRVTSLVFGPPAAPGQGRAEPEREPDCPPVDVRQGAATITVYGSGEQAPTNVRYQATVAQLARDCAVSAGTMTVRVGLQGRVILGPVGGPGRLDVPVRFALVRAGPNSQTVWTQLYRVPVDIPPGQRNVAFTHVDDRISFTMPSAADFDAYIFYVGFDQQGLREQPRGRRSQTRR